MKILFTGLSPDAAVAIGKLDAARYNLPCECAEPGETCSPCDYAAELTGLVEEIATGKIAPKDALSEAGLR